MRDQKAKTREKKTQERIKAEALVDLFLDWLFSSDSDAGWHGYERMGRIIDYGGKGPEGSGFCGFDNYEREIRFLADKSPDTCRAIELMDSLQRDQRAAVLSDRAYRGRTKVAVDPFRPESPVEILWTTAKCAESLGMSEATYRKNISRGYQALEAELREKRAA